MQAELVTRGASESEHVVGMAETAKCLAMLERDLSRADAMVMEARAVAARSRTSYHAIPAAGGILRYHAGELEEAEQHARAVKDPAVFRQATDLMQAISRCKESSSCL